MERAVYFIGAGPGDPELITVKAKKLIDKANVIVYAGSLVPKSIFASSQATEVIDSSKICLEDIVDILEHHYNQNKIVVRLHTGDPSLYGAIWEQLTLLEQRGVKCEIIPGVTSAFALAARVKKPFTYPYGNQTLIFTRLSGKTPVPSAQNLKHLAKTKSSLAIYLSATKGPLIQKVLLNAGYPKKTTVVIGYAVSWPQEEIFVTSLDKLHEICNSISYTKHLLYLILPDQGKNRSLLYQQAPSKI
ncbi:cobalt-precorrin-4/precorrin-4 C(11)-methyltransferase [Desulfonauticus submarinus]